MLLQIANTIFSDNNAVCLRQESMQELREEGESYTTIRMPKDMTPFHFASEFETEDVTDLLSTVPNGQGGGLAVTFASLQVISIAEIKFSEVNITRNEALVGGGASIHFAEMFWNNGARNSCYPIMFGVDLCQRFYLSQVRVTRNKAEYGAGLFTTHPEYIHLTGDIDHPVLGRSLEAMYNSKLSSRTHKAVQTEGKNGFLVLEDNSLTVVSSALACNGDTYFHVCRTLPRSMRDGKEPT